MGQLLIVDDEEEIRQFLREFFESKGYSVTVAGTKEEASEAFQRERPLVALLDIRMKSQRDGLDLLRQIRDQKLKIKTIMVTAVETQDVVQEAMNAGADDYITKPLSLEYLEETVAKKIGSLMDGSPDSG